MIIINIIIMTTNSGLITIEIIHPARLEPPRNKQINKYMIE